MACLFQQRTMVNTNLAPFMRQLFNRCITVLQPSLVNVNRILQSRVALLSSVWLPNFHARSQLLTVQLFVVYSETCCKNLVTRVESHASEASLLGNGE